MAAMQQIGFYFTRDGQLLSNEGEMNVHSDDGLIFTLHFGEVVFGSTSSASADNSSAENKASSSRYLFITCDFDERYFSLPKKPTDDSFLKKIENEWTDLDRQNKEIKDAYDQAVSKIENGQNLREDLNRRFADWYYLIDSEGFDKIHLKRDDLVVN